MESHPLCMMLDVQLSLYRPLQQCLCTTTAILAGAHSYFVVSSFKCQGKNSCHDLIPNLRIFLNILLSHILFISLSIKVHVLLLYINASFTVLYIFILASLIIDFYLNTCFRSYNIHTSKKVLHHLGSTSSRTFTYKWNRDPNKQHFSSFYCS